MGSRIRHTKNALNGKGNSSRPLFGNRLRFAIRTIRSAIERRRDGVGEAQFHHHGH